MNCGAVLRKDRNVPNGGHPARILSWFFVSQRRENRRKGNSPPPERYCYCRETSMSPQLNAELLRVEGLRIEFTDSGGGRSISFHIGIGEVLGLVGESGSGKSVLVKSLIRILPPNGRMTAGRILWRGENLRCATEARMRMIRGSDISMIFQNPQASLNPARKIGAQLQSLVCRCEPSGSSAGPELLQAENG
jgi:ATPase subunit of ABC transporter with duplicated ATPase domains